MYTSALCAYCMAAKNLLKQKGLDYEEIRIDTDPSRRDEMVACVRQPSPTCHADFHRRPSHRWPYDDLVAADRMRQACIDSWRRHHE